MRARMGEGRLHWFRVVSVAIAAIWIAGAGAAAHAFLTEGATDHQTVHVLQALALVSGAGVVLFAAFHRSYRRAEAQSASEDLRRKLLETNAAPQTLFDGRLMLRHIAPVWADRAVSLRTHLEAVEDRMWAEAAVYFDSPRARRAEANAAMRALLHLDPYAAFDETRAFPRAFVADFFAALDGVRDMPLASVAVSFDSTIQDPDGGVRDVRVYVRAVEDGEPWETCVATYADLTAERAREAELRRLTLIAESATDAIVTTDLDRRITWASGRFEALTGWRLEDAIGQPLRAVIPALDMTREDVDATNAAITNGEPVHIVMHTMRRDGARYWNAFNAAVLADASGAATGYVGVLRDVTAQAETTARLREAEALYRSVFDAMGEGVCVMDADGAIVAANAAAETILGLTLDQMRGRTSTDPRWRAVRENGEDFPGEEHAITLALRTGRSYRNSAMGVHTPDGALRWLVVNAEPLRDPNTGAARGSLATFADVTARREEERRRSHTLAMLSELERIGRIGVWEYAPHAGQVWLSPEAAELLGRADATRRDQIVPLADISSAEQERLVQAARACIDDGGVFERETFYTYGGVARWLRMTGQRTERPDGPTVVGAVQDITAAKAAERLIADARDAAESANRAKSEFLANMSHELRTPLNGVIGVASALADTALSDPQREMVELIENSGRSLERILSDILDLSKIEAGGMTLEAAPYQPRAEIAAVGRLMKARAEAKGLAFTMTFDGDLDRAARGDAVRVKQIVGNLLSNAVKFTAAGAVALHAACEAQAAGASWLVVTVRDTGEGFDAAFGERLFARFTQADGSITRRHGGTGLGLSICKALCDLMGGSIAACSTPGEGSVFTVRLPLAIDGQPAAPADPAAGLDGVAERLRGARVMVVDDNPVNQKVAALFLTAFGAAVEIVDDGDKAVAAWREGRHDAIFMDVQMPVMDGLTAVRAIRAAEAASGAPRTPIVMLSAHAMADDVERSHAAGADAHVCKPVTRQRLLAGLAAALAPAAEAVRAA